MSDETPEEVAYRLRNEQRCAEVARELDAKLRPDGLQFCLVLTTVNAAEDSKRFHNMSYVSTCNREDAARLLSELLERWWDSGVVTEPSPKTATVLREAVYKIRGTELHKVMTNARHRVREMSEATSPKDRAMKALLLACEALAVFDVESRRVQRDKAG